MRRLDASRVSVRLGGAEIVVPDTVAAEGEVTVAVRPEAISVEMPPGPANALPGAIAKASYLGTHMEYSIETEAGILFATCPRVERPPAVGDKVALVLASRGVITING